MVDRERQRDVVRIKVMRKERERHSQKKNRHIIVWITFLEAVVVIVGLAVLLLSREDKDVDALLEQDATIDYIEEAETEAIYVPKPKIDTQLLTVNEYSRPGTKTKGIEYIVIHYLGNPKTTAQQNHDYFESLKDLEDTYMSANYVVGLKGEIIQCVPDDEIAYASNEMNDKSISIENCHRDETGKLNEKTYESLVKLTAYLTEKYHIEKDHIIRHYDVTGKECPKYYVENEDKWEEFKEDVMKYREECLQKYKSTEIETEMDRLAAYLESISSELETELQK